MSPRQRGGAVAIAILFLATFSASSVAQASSSGALSALPRGASDITATAKGRALIAQTSVRYAAKGLRPQTLRVIKDAAGFVVAPANTKFATVEVDIAGGQKGIAVAPLTPDAPAAPGVSPAAITATPSWTFQDNACFTRFGNDDFSWMDHCYYMYRLSNDGNGSYDWFALNHYATMGANSPWVLRWGLIRAYRYGSSPQTWADWDPAADWQGGSCGQISLSISVGVANLGTSVERCPQIWDMSKSANGTSPDYTLQWVSTGTRSNRALKFEIAVRVAQGGWAQWALPAEVHGWPY